LPLWTILAGPFGVEGVAEAVNRPNESWSSAVVVECATDLAHEIREVCFHDERVRPQPIVQLDFRQRLRPDLDQPRKQLKRFVGQLNGLAAAEQLARF
jgi:hypothetical protein